MAPFHHLDAAKPLLVPALPLPRPPDPDEALLAWLYQTSLAFLLKGLDFGDTVGLGPRPQLRVNFPVIRRRPSGSRSVALGGKEKC